MTTDPPGNVPHGSVPVDDAAGSAEGGFHSVFALARRQVLVDQESVALSEREREKATRVTRLALYELGRAANLRVRIGIVVHEREVAAGLARGHDHGRRFVHMIPGV